MLHGILQRSGTNLLNEILLMSPSVAQPVLKVRENWFLHYSDSLYEYSDELFQKWTNPKWGGDDYSKSEFYNFIGEALVNYIGQKIPDLPNKSLLSKTPSVQRLERNLQLFPSSKIIIITRDPRDIAASALKTWGRPIQKSIKDWNLAAKAISDFEKQASPDSYLLLRYEDLLSNQKKWVTKCLQFLELDTTNFPWSDLINMPVFGSSDNEGKWEVKPATASFQPLSRRQSLSKDEASHFTSINASSMDYFGYTTRDEDSPCLPTRTNRLAKEITLTSDCLQPNKSTLSFSDRATKFKTGLKLMRQAVIG